MKKTQSIDLIKSIQRDRVTFIAIVVFVALGIAFYCGFLWTVQHNREMVNAAARNYQLQTFQLSYPLGLDEQQLQELGDIDGIDVVETTRVAYRFFQWDGKRQQAAVYQLTESINLPMNVVGTLPDAPDEIAVIAPWAEKHGVSVGDTITFDTLYASDAPNLEIVKQIALWDGDPESFPRTSDEQISSLRENVFRVTALLDNPLYFCTNPSVYLCNPYNSIAINAIFYVDESAINAKAFSGETQVLFVSKKLQQMDGYSQEYAELSQAIAQEISQKTRTWHTETEEGYTAAVEKFRGKLSDAEEQLESAQEEIEKNEALLREKEQELADGIALLEEKQTQAEDGEAQYDAGFEKYQLGLDDYHCMLELYNSGLHLHSFKTNVGEEYDKAKTRFTAAREACEARFSPAAARQRLFDACGVSSDSIQGIIAQIMLMDPEDINQQADEWLAALTEILDKVRRGLAEAESVLAHARDELAEGWKSLNEGAKQIEEGKKQLKTGKEQLRETKSKLEDNRELLYSDQNEIGMTAQELYEELKSSEAAIHLAGPVVTQQQGITSVNTLNSVNSFFSTANGMLSVVFFIVGILIGYSAVSRMVENAKKQLGTKKALGFMPKEIIGQYTAYVAFAAAFGMALGTALALGLESVLSFALARNFHLPSRPLTVRFGDMLFPFLCELILLELTAMVGCMKNLKLSALSLLSGNTEQRSVPAFLRKSKLFSRLPLLNQTIAINLFRDRKRVLGMLIGIAGSTLLMSGGLIALMNCSQSFQAQFRDYFHFDSMIHYDSTVEGAGEEIEEYLSQNGIGYSKTMFFRCNVSRAERNASFFNAFVVYNADDLNQLVDFRDSSGKSLEYDSGLWLNNYLEKSYGREKGELLSVTPLTGSEVHVPISEFFQAYIMPGDAFMDAETYEAQFGTAPVANTYLISTDTADRDALCAGLEKINGYISLSDFRQSSFEILTPVKGTILMICSVFIAMSFLLSLMVVVNLLSVYVEEKKKELITLLINGYSRNYAKKYIYLDTAVLAVAGIIIGVIVGSFIGESLVSSFERGEMYLKHQLNFVAMGISVAATGIMTGLITVISLRRVDGFKLSDINN